jgi:heptosyltransferase-2
VKPARGKILVVRGGAIGDFILTLPVLAALRKQLPESHLEVLGYPHIAQLALAGQLADEVRSIEARPLAGFFARHGPLEEKLMEYFAGFALIVSYLYDPDLIFQENVARCSKAQFIAGPHRPDETSDEHATAVFLKPLERLAIFDADPVPLLSLNVQPLTLNQLALHPGSGSEKKNWPEENWRQLMEHLARGTDLNLLLVGGEAEGDRLQRLAAALPGERIQLAQNLSLSELARRLMCCLGFIGHDSGISHLAAAVGLPTLALWGDTRQSIWRPRGDHVTVIASPMGVGGISVGTVAAEAVRRFPG